MKKLLHFFCRTLIFVFFASSIFSCLKLNSDEHTPESPVGIIPDNFDWKTVKELSCTVRVSPVTNIGDNMVRIIKIFNTPLLNDGAMIASGAALPGSPYIVKITLATVIPTIYVQEILPNGVKTVKAVDVTASFLDITFSQVTKAFAPATKSSPSPSIAIPTGYDVQINDNSTINLTGFSSGQSSAYGNTYKSYLIPAGFVRTASLGTGNWQSHSILYVKGTYRITGTADLNNLSIVVLNGGRVEVKSITTGVSNADIITIYVEAGGTLITSGGIAISNGKYIVNKGTMTLGGDFNITNSSDVYNEGTLTVSNTEKKKSILLSNSSFLYNSVSIKGYRVSLSDNSSVLNDSGSSLETGEWYQSYATTTNNHGHIVATTKFATGGGGTINNFCKIVSNVSELQGSIINLYEGSLFNCQTINSNNVVINMTGGSMLLTGTINSIYSMKVRSSSDSYSVFKCTGAIPDLRWAACEFNGKIELVHSLLVEGSGSNGRVLYEALFNNNGSVLSKVQTNNILATTCNDAAGQIVAPPPSVVDKDNDGVAAEFDIDDNDASVAFVSYFPSSGTWGTYAFEDLWPLKGDYDVNDLVIGFRISYFTNSSNQVTGLKFDYNMRAAGSKYSLATAFQLDKISASNIASVSGQELSGSAPFTVGANGTEQNTSLAIIPLFNNQGAVVSYSGYLNTEKNADYVITPDRFVYVKFASPVQQSDVAMNSFNLFIVANARGNEIHLPSFKATSHFDASTTAGSQLHPNDIFKYIDGMMWGLMIPESFLYPLEFHTIISAYTHFGDWAISGGTSYTDWYKPIAGYINEEHIYQ
ncbi:MAG: LruC domain-containing protein [Bacteroidales bacterium]